MFDIVANLITIVIAYLFPIFASYKALASSHPAQLIPWLQYFLIITLFNLAESFVPFLSYFPFYGWLRLALHLFLLVPGPNQGAGFVYTTYVHPFLREHEREIDDFISTSHERARAAGLLYVKQLVEWLRVNMLGQTPAPPSPPPSRSTSYAQNLLTRFYLPTGASSAGASNPPTAPSGDWFNMIGNLGTTLAALGTQSAASNLSRAGQAEDLAASGSLIPADLRSDDEKLTYIARQQNAIRVLLQAFDREASSLNGGLPTTPSRNPPSPFDAFGFARPASSASGPGSDTNLSKSRSELDFDKIEFDEADHARSKPPTPGSAAAAATAWMPWNWAGKPPVESEKKEL